METSKQAPLNACFGGGSTKDSLHLFFAVMKIGFFVLNGFLMGLRRGHVSIADDLQIFPRFVSSFLFVFLVGQEEVAFLGARAVDHTGLRQEQPRDDKLHTRRRRGGLSFAQSLEFLGVLGFGCVEETCLEILGILIQTFDV